MTDVKTVRNSLTTLSSIESIEINRLEKQLSINTNKPLSADDIEEKLPAKYTILPLAKSNLHNKNIEGNKSKWVQLKPLFLILGYILISSTLLHIQDWSLQAMMLDFMGCSFWFLVFLKYWILKDLPTPL